MRLKPPFLSKGCFEFFQCGHCYQVVIFAFLLFALSHNEADTSLAERVCIGLQSTADTSNSID